MIKIIIAAGPVIVENNRVLLNKDDKDNFWKFCGGKINESETDLKETARREAREEMGIDIKIEDNSPYFFYTEKDNDGLKTSVVLVHFLAKRSGEIVSGDDIKKWAWLDLANLDQEILAPNIKPALKYFGFIK